nr:hypothetical protein [Tanacetum cinerariifolium]
EAVYKELGDRLVRAAITASSLEAEPDSGNIAKTQFKETPNEPSSKGTDLSGGPKCQATIWDTIAQTSEMDQFCEMKGILRQFSVARTPQQNGIAERRNKTLIEAARTMLADSKTPTLSFMRPFGCPVTSLNTIDHLGKFDGKADECFFVGYSLNSKAFRVFNNRTRIVEDNLHIRFSENTPNIVGSGPDWLFDINALTKTMNYEPIVTGTQSNGFAGTKASDNASQARKNTEPVKDYILLSLWTADLPFSQDLKSSHDDGSKPSSDDGKKVDEDPRKENECNDQEKEDSVNNTNNVNIISSSVNTAGTNEVNAVGENISIKLQFNPNMPALEDVSTFDVSSDDEDDSAMADMNNLDITIQVSPILTTRIHKDHPLDQVIRDLQPATQTRKMLRNLEQHGEMFFGKVTPLFPTMVQQLGEDEAVYKELGDRLVRAAITASSLEAEPDSGNITKTQFKETPNEPSSKGTDLSGGPRCQETIWDTIAQTRVLSGVLLEKYHNYLRRIEALYGKELGVSFCSNQPSKQEGCL